MGSWGLCIGANSDEKSWPWGDALVGWLCVGVRSRFSICSLFLVVTARLFELEFLQHGIANGG